MEMEEAFNVMLGSLYSVHASRSQVNGVLAWRESACAAAARARDCERRAIVPGAGETRVHGAWARACEAIIAALRAMEAEAELLHLAARAEADAVAAERDSLLRLAAAEAAPGPRQELLARAMAAERARAEAEARAARAMAWRIAANNAAGEGALLVRSQDALLAPVVTAVADMNGEAALVKTYHSL
jgi:hypothetical protein